MGGHSRPPPALSTRLFDCHGIREPAFEYAECLASAVPTVPASFDHFLGWRVPAGLGKRDAVQGGVQLAVPGAAQPVPGLVRRPDRQWRGAVIAGVGVAGLELVDAGGLADDFGRGEGAATRYASNPGASCSQS